MTILQTLAIFVGGPLVIYVLLGALAMLPGRRRRRPAYRAGGPWDYPAHWWSGDQPIAAVDASMMVAGAEGGARGNW